MQPDPSAAPSHERLAESWRAIGLAVLLFVAVLAVYSRAFRQPFSNYDDAIYILDEPHVAGGFSRSGLIWALTKGPAGDWCPLAMLSHMLDCQLFELNPAGHHATNVLLHAATAAVLLLVLWRMTGALFASTMVAALFALHPLRVESVAWIAERRDVLSGLFFMLTLAAYGEYVRRPSTGRYLAVALLLAMGLLAKSILVTVPVLLLLLDYWPLGRFRGTRLDPDAAEARSAPFPWRVVWEKVPLLALALAATVVTLIRHAGPAPNPVLTLPERLAGAIVSCTAYLGQMLVPIGMSIFYPHPEAGLPIWEVAGAAVLLLSISVAAIASRRAYPFFFVGWFWYLLLLVPVLEVIPVGPHARADRYTYLSQIGLLIALVWGAVRLVGAWPARRWALGIVSAAVLVAISAVTWRQLGFWNDSISLWQHAVDCDPTSATAHFWLGTVWQKTDEDRAVKEYRQALNLRPGDQNFYYGIRAQAASYLGNIAVHRGQVAEATADFREALQQYDGYVAVHLKLAGLLAQQGDLPGAFAELRRCIELEPDNPAVYNYRGQLLAELGRLDDAIADVRKAAELDDQSATIHANLADFLLRRGDVDGAIEQLRRVTKLEPDSPDAFFQVGRLLRGQGRADEAAKYEQLGVAADERRAARHETR